jgi:hypothetical protein
MTQVRETLGIMDRGPPSLTSSIKSKKGVHVSQSLAIILAAIYAVSVIATGLLVYNFAACPHLNLSGEMTTVLCNETYDDATTTDHPSNHQTEKPIEKPDVRLPRSIRPTQYDIKLVPFIFEGNFTFKGEIAIVVEAMESSDNITLHAAELEIYETEVSELSSGEVLKVARYSNDTEKEFHVIHMIKNLTRGNRYRIYMKFEGKLNDNLHGFYRSSYRMGNTTRYGG